MVTLTVESNQLYASVALFVHYLLLASLETALERRDARSSPPPYSILTFKAFNPAQWPEAPSQLAWLSTLLVWLYIDSITDGGINEGAVFTILHGLRDFDMNLVIGMVSPRIFAPIVLIWLVNAALTTMFTRCSVTRVPSILTLHRLKSLLLIACFVINPLANDLLTTALSTWSSDTRLNPSFTCISAPPALKFDPLPQLESGFERTYHNLSQPTNLVIIYAESFDFAYFDEEAFPNLLPRLKRLQSRSLTFEDVYPSFGSTWSIAGKVASQCGAPLTTLFGRKVNHNIDGNVERFTPGYLCLGDILEHQRYQSSIFMGHKATFASEGKFAQHHGNATVVDRSALLRLNPHLPLTSWGVNDDFVFETAMAHISDLKRSNSGPFFAVVETMDTHHPGFPSPACRALPALQHHESPILQAIACLDHLVSNFIEHVASADTLVLLLADHPAMFNEVSHILHKYPPRNTAILFGGQADVDHDRRISRRKLTMMDIAPTILSLMGLPTAALGFGRDAFNLTQATLRELARNDDLLDSHLLSWSRQSLVAEGVWKHISGRKTELPASYLHFCDQLNNSKNPQPPGTLALEDSLAIWLLYSRYSSVFSYALCRIQWALLFLHTTWLLVKL